MQTLQDNITVKNMKSPVSVNADGTGTIIDTYGTEPEKFDSAFVLVNVGAITGTPTSIGIKVEESDSSSFASGVSDCDGGASVNVSQNTLYTFQVKRTKRYLRINYDFTGGTSPTMIVGAAAVLNNWATPYPVV